MPEDRIEHHAEDGAENDDTDPEYVDVELVHLLRDRRHGRLQVELERSDRNARRQGEKCRKPDPPLREHPAPHPESPLITSHAFPSPLRISGFVARCCRSAGAQCGRPVRAARYTTRAGPSVQSSLGAARSLHNLKMLARIRRWRPPVRPENVIGPVGPRLMAERRATRPRRSRPPAVPARVASASRHWLLRRACADRRSWRPSPQAAGRANESPRRTSSAWLRQPKRSPTTSSTGRRRHVAMSSMSWVASIGTSTPPAPSTTTKSECRVMRS